MVKDFMGNIELQAIKKEKSILQSKISQFETENLELKKQINILSTNNLSETESSKIKLSDIKLKENIRDMYEFEEIENLALDIAINGQLQPVLLTKDNYLLAGYRRYNAIKLLNEKPELFNNLSKIDTLNAYKIDKNSSEINDQELKDIQFAENNERRSIDNFQLSKLYNYYLENNCTQKDLAEKFKKSKGFISGIVTIMNIEKTLVNLLKEFQVYGWSKTKYEQLTSENIDENKLHFYHENKGIIGWRPLYEIAKQKDPKEQKKTFSKLFKNRLTEEELNSDYFKDVEKNVQKDKSLLEQTLKYTNALNKTIDKLSSDSSKNTKNYIDIKDKISELETLLKHFDLVKQKV